MSNKAIVAKIKSTAPIVGADFLQSAVVLGETVVVSKDVNVGDVGIYFPAGVQLSEKYCFENNLNRDKEKNKDKEKGGFFEDNRRVRTQKLRGVNSDGYFAPLDSVGYTGIDLGSLAVGMEFDELLLEKICCKYISKASKEKIGKERTKQAKLCLTPEFSKHVDTEQFKFYANTIPKGALLHFHSKKHGTSFCVAKTKTMLQLPKWKQIVNKIVGVFPEWEYKNTVGTRNYILQNSTKEGFHGSEQFRFDVAASIFPHLEDGVAVYGEIVGYVNGKPIMPEHNVAKLKDKCYQKKYGDKVVYSRSCKEHELKWHVYRVTKICADGTEIDLTQKQMENWCEQREFPTTLEAHPSMIYDGDVESLTSLVEQLTEREDVLTEDMTDNSHPLRELLFAVNMWARHQSSSSLNLICSRL